MKRIIGLLISLTVVACATANEDSWPFVATPIAKLDEPWAMTFLPDGRMLVTEKRGRLRIVTSSSAIGACRHSTAAHSCAL